MGKPRVNSVYLESFPSVVTGDLSLHQGSYIRESNRDTPLDEFDGRSPLRRNGITALSGSTSRLIGFDTSRHLSSGPGILRSKFTAVDSHGGQVSKSALGAFLAIRSLKRLELFAQSNGFLGLYPTVQFWRDPDEKRLIAGKPADRKVRIVGEPADSWLWHIDRLKTLSDLVNVDMKDLSQRAIEQRVRRLFDGSVRAFVGKKRYTPLHEANDLGEDDPLLSGLRQRGARGCREFVSTVVEDMLRRTLVVVDFRDGEPMLGSTCLLGFLYLQFAFENGLLNSRGHQAFTLCRWCNEEIQRKTRGPAPIYCNKCINARRNYTEAEAFSRRQEAMWNRELTVQGSVAGELVKRYYKLYGVEEGMSKIEVALKKGLPDFGH